MRHRHLSANRRRRLHRMSHWSNHKVTGPIRLRGLPRRVCLRYGHSGFPLSGREVQSGRNGRVPRLPARELFSESSRKMFNLPSRISVQRWCEEERLSGREVQSIGHGRMPSLSIRELFSHWIRRLVSLSLRISVQRRNKDRQLSRRDF